MRIELLRSLIFHATVVAVCLLFLRQGDVSTLDRRVGPLQIEITAGSAGYGSTDDSSPVKPSRSTRRKRPLPGLESLGTAMPLPGANSGSETVAGGKNGLEVRDGYDVAADMTLEEETEALPFLEALRRRVDGAIGYPDDFVDERVQGSVTVHFNVDRRGALIGDFIRVDSEETMLEAYVLAILAHVLREPLPERNWGENGIMIVSRFEFKVLAGFAGTQPPRSSRVKNLLTFRRESLGEPWLNKEIERFYARFIPPLIPVPGGFFIDFARAYQMIANIDSQTASPDERRRRRIELGRAKWEQVVRGGGTPKGTSSPEQVL